MEYINSLSLRLELITFSIFIVAFMSSASASFSLNNLIFSRVNAALLKRGVKTSTSSCVNIVLSFLRDTVITPMISPMVFNGMHMKDFVEYVERLVLPNLLSFSISSTSSGDLLITAYFAMLVSKSISLPTFTSSPRPICACTTNVFRCGR